MIDREYKIFEFYSLKLTQKWMNRWAVLGFRVVSVSVTYNIFGTPNRYIVLLERINEHESKRAD